MDLKQLISRANEPDRCDFGTWGSHYYGILQTWARTQRVFMLLQLRGQRQGIELFGDNWEQVCKVSVISLRRVVHQRWAFFHYCALVSTDSA